MISKRFALANHTMLDKFDMNKRLQHLIYLDANNLYGWAMSQYLSTGKFKRLNADSFPIETFEGWLMSIPKDSTKGYIFEVDMDYPKHLHDLHNCYPLAPEKMKILKEMLSKKFLEFKDTTENLSSELAW